MHFGFSNLEQKKEQQRQENVIILFVCVENAGRSQMAEGFFNYKYAPKGYHAIALGLNLFLKSTPLRFR
jgi:protein-tyrosine-phosphatase